MKYLIKDSTVENIANAIREKTGKTDKFTMEQAVDEINSIQTDGGGDDTETLKGLIEGSIKTVNIPYGIEEIRPYCFYRSYVEIINVPNTVTSIDDNAFNYCTSLKEITLPNSLTNIGGYVFSQCNNLLSVNIPSGITTINGTFYACKALKKVTLPEGLQRIESYTFYNCSSLTNISIPSTVTYIGVDTFTMSSVNAINMYSETPPKLGGSSALPSTSNLIILVPHGTGQAYKTAQYWSSFASKIHERS